MRAEFTRLLCIRFEKSLRFELRNHMVQRLQQWWKRIVFIDSCLRNIGLLLNGENSRQVTLLCMLDIRMAERPGRAASKSAALLRVGCATRRFEQLVTAKQLRTAPAPLPGGTRISSAQVFAKPVKNEGTWHALNLAFDELPIASL